jgi:Spy/CpxP family protein refolding chaperone
MKVKLSIAVSVLVFAGVCFLGNLYAQPAGIRQINRQEIKRGSKQGFERMAEDLGLTPGQRERLQENRDRHRQERENISQLLKEKKLFLREELQKQELDKTKINQIHKELKVLLSEKEDLRLNSILDTREVLTPEQFKIMKERMQERAHKSRSHEDRPKERKWFWQKK